MLSVGAGVCVLYYIMIQHLLYVRSGWHPGAVPTGLPATIQYLSDHTGIPEAACSVFSAVRSSSWLQSFRSSVYDLKIFSDWETKRSRGGKLDP